MRKFLSVMIMMIIFTYAAFAQVSFTEDFEDGDFSGWTEGTTDDWVVDGVTPLTGTYSLKHNLSGVSGTSYIVHQEAGFSVDGYQTTWRFNLKNGDWDPSSSNNFNVVLFTDSMNLSSNLSGYVVGVNYTGFSDLITLWRVDDGSPTELIVSDFNWENNNFVGVEVTRTAGGSWELKVDSDGGFDALVSKGTASDLTYTTGDYTGLLFNFTSSRAGTLYFDDFSVNQTIVLDQDPIISNITSSAKIPAADEDLTITATITDDNAVAVAEIHFKVDNGVNNAVVMTNTGGDTYEGTISASMYNNGQLLDWWIYVEDNGANISESQHTLLRVGTINISDLHQVDGDGVPLYLDQLVRIQGVVTVEDSVFSTSSLDAYIQDATGGVNVFLPGGGDFDFPENDEFAVIGTVDLYNGKTEVIPDSLGDITFIGNATPVVPEEVTFAQILSDPESYEGKLVIVRNVSKVSGNWGGNVNLDVTDDGGTTVFTLRIDRDTDIDENMEPAWPQDVTAIVGQFDNSVPYDDGYQILPRRYTDFATPQGQDEFPVINTNSIPFDAFEPGVQTITAEVTDDNQVSSVELYYYFIINDTWPTLPADTVSVSMNLTTGDTYAADVDLSNLSNGDGFVYWVEATDNIGQQTETNPFEVLVGTSPLSKAHVLGQSGLAYDGFYGKFTGVITAEPGLFSTSYFFMQDATGGVEIYRSGGFDENYVNGDSLLVTGYIGEFSGLSQLENYTITLLKSGATITPPEITTADVGEMYEGMLVTIPDLDTLAGQSTEWVTTGSSFNLDMGDEEGNIVVRIATDTLKNSPEPQWPSTITGVLTLYQGNYQLQPRYPSDISTLLSVGDDEQITEQFEVYQNYPNPFNPSTIVAFNLPRNGQVSLKVFNIMGQVVKSMDLKGKMGRNEVTVDFSSLSTGIYFYQISFESNVVTKKMMFIK